MAAASTVTKNIKLGSAVSVLSSSDPVKLYQSFATVDLISNGRAELMAGRGSFIESFPLYGQDLKDYDALFDEKLRLLLQINQQDPISWKGKFRPELKNQTILPRALNNNLKMWVAVGGTPESVVRAATLGLPVMFAIIGGSPVQFKPLFEYYKNVYQQSGHDMDKFEIGVHVHAFFGEDSNEIGEYYYPIYSGQMDRIGRSRGWPAYQRAQFDRGRGKGGHLIIGDVNESVDKILELHELFGLTRFSAHMDVGAPSHDRMMKSIEVFGTKIAPKVREALRM
ncbi:LLM class flavin-dependent oxidoreductase [Niabella ginsengisoli]|uniref:LLM class flavin-dependent oxidoreductase n=1 Tax=Niabella ginsengisoli TaxID=522298 RepID=A0ABS9SIC3_9BACT|nr:LLM class flavin-dependent oxidoreductase [Niabella ginsengisoli]MCH5598111.1 LLM class flavin-dependent oxidoreductase [Niabella ginsengisoli]